MTDPEHFDPASELIATCGSGDPDGVQSRDDVDIVLAPPDDPDADTGPTDHDPGNSGSADDTDEPR